jgi:acyl transferase domain-containing protein
MAHDDAGVRPRDVQYVEAHGTATPLGDPIEIAALAQAFARDGAAAARGSCGVGSVKSNIGHTTAAAGAAGLIKVALALHHEELPGTAHFRAPNPRIPFADTPFRVVDGLAPWARGAAPRLAGVSSFGVGGTNAHVVVGEAPPPAPSGPSAPAQLLVLSARTPAALGRAASALAAHLEASPGLPLADAAYTLAVGRSAFAERRAVVARDAAEAVRKLRADAADARGTAASPAPPVVFLFPGRAPSTSAWGRNLYDAVPEFRLAVDECAEVVRPRLGRDLRELLYPADAARERAAAELRQTAFTQTALFAVEYALARTLVAWGVTPAALCGHSVGEFVAACLAGVLSFEDAARLVCARGQLMQAMPPGAMLGVRAAAGEVRGWLPPALELAAENAPGLCVVAGPSDAVARFAAELEARGVPARALETSHAFHSRSMEPAAARFADEVGRVALSAPRIPIVSTATGAWLTDAEACDPGYWATHLRRTVRFAAAVETLAADPRRVLVEVGPRRTLTTLALQRRPGDDAPRPAAVACLADRADDAAEWVALQGALGRLWAGGVPVDFRAFFAGERRRRVALPGYQFSPDRHWLDRPAPAAPAAQVAPPAADAPPRHRPFPPPPSPPSRVPRCPPLPPPPAGARASSTT